MSDVKYCTLKPVYLECQYCLQQQKETGMLLCDECGWYRQIFTILYETETYAYITDGKNQALVPIERINRIDKEEIKNEN